MTPLEMLAVFAAGVGAGGINAVVGSGSLITFPTLLAVGLPPIPANVSNNIGLVPGSWTSAYGYRAELKGQLPRLLRLGAGSVAGALLGGGLLLTLPPEAFEFIVPALIALGCVLVVVQPKMNAWLLARRRNHHAHGGPWLWTGVFACGVYGGYFGAAQGVLLLAILGIFLDDDLQRLNGAKNVLSGLVNTTAAVLFIAVAKPDWTAVLLVALGSTVGGYLGARLGRKIPPLLFRVIIVCVGVIAIISLLTD
ncbi:sulfite exporter TauE/SafE family protein [Bailinhaonella thermotolerans]|uniref:Probable membrane transporter protein n=1 Tax=Bailinhaonella thermotolerans TaxID=1070861 RepID=A0A3A4A0B4_9ACTN|nr:sulfite exporter TauE/SafE family protein [Bailinhaonella thermotolerans]RJL20378.1 sulfite exporter TauE/SafE family protein [Bailinhaonella thermotolerans]